ncbi:MAG: formate dehydrogenase accessory sulfurtransferase FdhD [Acidimicrobiales bacterium]|nr:formate dehydrogenase accessory sulfurtransferase FdhD [Acidimicrobiales bacterium]MDP7258705.1 formate dehydrogenase accessory sulfurtransferase FdhD [Acidimicrobiales bacterium]HJO80050.1 formate dehydrogenase accessory sulfurtransferase FdhD [Acidimicrobiales bacterium]
MVAEVASRGRTERVLTRRVDGVESRRTHDDLIVEEPMSIRLDGTLVATTMRTPGDDFDLAVGFCVTEGVLDGTPVKGVRYCGEGPAGESAFNDVTVETGGLAPVPTPRLNLTSSSCGLCGSITITELSERLEPLEVEPFDLDLLAGLADRIGVDQPLFGATGAVHAAVAFDRAGIPVVEREDIGRHNAVDKVIGHLHLNDLLPATGLGLWVSGRASFEIAQKAWTAGFAALVAVSAPSALAVETARVAGFQLVGFARGRRLNLYTED